MSDGFGEKFLNRHESRLDGWVRAAVESNEAEAIASLVNQTHTEDLESPWHTVNIARRAAAQGLDGGKVLCLVGELDRISQPHQCAALAKPHGWKCVEIPEAGHTVPIESPRVWRTEVLKHFGEVE